MTVQDIGRLHYILIGDAEKPVSEPFQLDEFTAL